MAGSSDRDKDLGPDEAAILVATQDMYFSQALNRGYARRPPRRPVDSRCAGDLDATRLLLQGVRDLPDGSVCVEATVNPEWPRTVDFEEQLRVIPLSGDDRHNEGVTERWRGSRCSARTRAPPEPTGSGLIEAWAPRTTDPHPME